MSLLKRITFNQQLFYGLLYAGFILLHILFFNINAAEWGDSYRILRASEYIRLGTYPVDEKRPPLFSAILATRPAPVDQIFFGRAVLLVFSILSLFLFEKITRLFIKNEKYRKLTLALFCLNPVLFYWSLRIYADVPFMFFVLLAFYLLTRWKEKISVTQALVLGLICGLSVWVRFEGYFLSLAIFVGIFYRNLKTFKDFFTKIVEYLKNNFVTLFAYGIGVAVVVIRFWVFRNPLNSSYFEEPGGRVYNIEMVLIFLASLVYLFGFTSAGFFFIKDIKGTLKTLLENPGIFAFVALELTLILFWPAALPRLFIPILPFLLIPLTLALEKHFETSQKKFVLKDLIGLSPLFLLLILVPLVRFYLKLQFVLIQKEFLLAVILLQIPVIYFIYKKQFKAFALFVCISSLVWALSPVYLHKDLYLSIKEASEYTAANVTGFVGYNDKSSVADWYLNDKDLSSGTGSSLHGEYYYIEANKNIELSKLKARGYDYLLLTNEHNTSTTLDIDKRPYLEVIKNFSYNINGVKFFTLLLKVNKEY